MISVLMGGKRKEGVMDYISREDAIDCVLGQYCASSDETEEALGNAIEEIKKRPAADVVERKKGKWLPVPGHNNILYCSNCTNEVIGRNEPRNFCPNCGAKME